jgi:hypothetical protein
MARAQLMAPYMDKGYSLQIFDAPPEVRGRVMRTIHSQEAKSAHPFLQGDSDN